MCLNVLNNLQNQQQVSDIKWEVTYLLCCYAFPVSDFFDICTRRKNPLKPVEVWMLKGDPRLKTRWVLCPKDNCINKNKHTEEERQKFVLTSRIFLSLHCSDLRLGKYYEVLN